MTEPNYMRVDLGGGREGLKPVVYPSNSRSKKQATDAPPPKEVKSVVTGEVTQRKKSVWFRAKSNLVNEDTGSVGQYVVLEVLLPALKNMVSDAVSKGIDALLFGEGSRVRHTRGDRPSVYTNYTTRMKRSEPAYGVISPRGRATHELDEVLIPTRGEAEDVLQGLFDLLNTYKVATVLDFYSLAGITSEFTDERWGWTNLDRARIRQVRAGYVVDLPRPEPID